MYFGWNVKGINGIPNREELIDVFRKGKFKLLALTETKLKENGEVSWCGVNGVIASVHEIEKARKGVAVLLNDVWQSAVINFECVSSRILLVKFKFSRVKLCVVAGYVPTEDNGEER